MNDIFVLTFHTTHDALTAAAACADAGIPHEKIPTPRALSSECGFAVQAGPVPGAKLCGLIKAAGLRPEASYLVSGGIPVTYSRCETEA